MLGILTNWLLNRCQRQAETANFVKQSAPAAPRLIGVRASSMVPRFDSHIC